MTIPDTDPDTEAVTAAAVSPPTGLPARTTVCTVDGRTVYLLGTAHVSRESVADVEAIVAAVRPETICVELCPARLQALTRRDAWRNMDIVQIIRKRQAVFLLAQLALSSFYRQLGDRLGVEPGAEMLAGVTLAEEIGARLVAADRPIDITLKRVWRNLGWWQKLKMSAHLLAGIISSESVDEKTIEELKEKDQLDHALDAVGSEFPEVKRRLIDERDQYLAEKIRRAPGKTIVAVVGAGHVAGIVRHLPEVQDLATLEELPPPSPLPRIVGWSIPVLVIGMLVAGFFRYGGQHTLASISIWLLANGLLAGIGAAAAFGHPLTVLSAMAAAPLTSLNPLVAAGWVAGLVQTFVHRPTVADLENLPQATSSVAGFWRNPASRILLVVVLANLGSSLGTLISGSWIAARFF
jgi:pheromone shutdown-related protein TraB